MFYLSGWLFFLFTKYIINCFFWWLNKNIFNLLSICVNLLSNSFSYLIYIKRKGVIFLVSSKMIKIICDAFSLHYVFFIFEEIVIKKLTIRLKNTNQRSTILRFVVIEIDYQKKLTFFHLKLFFLNFVLIKIFDEI